MKNSLQGRTTVTRKENAHKSPFSERFGILGEEPKIKRPTWIKSHRKYIDPETLDAYELPWQWDLEDSNYIIIKRYINEELQEELFDHTRKLRARSDYASIADRADQGRQRTDRTAPPFEQTVARKRTADRLEERYGFEAIKKISILRACRFRDPYGKESAVLKYQDDVETALETPAEMSFRWIHLKWRARSLSEFERFAVELRGVDVDDRLIIRRLMQTVKDRYERDSASGRTLKPIAVRCDGQDPTAQKKADRWGLFLCFPYFSVKSAAGPQDSHKPQFHTTKTLLQARFPLETISGYDHEQIISQTGHLTKDQFLHVPLLWALILSSGLLLSSSPESLEATVGEDLQLEKLSANSSEGGQAERVIRAIDPDLKIFFFPLAECMTWFALMDRVLSVCHSKFGNEPQKYRITQPDGTLLNAETWQHYSSAETPVVNIVIRLLSSSPSWLKSTSEAPEKKRITWQEIPPDNQALILRSTKSRAASKIEEETIVQVRDDKLLDTVRPRPPQYSPSPKNPPPNRIPRYMMPLPENLVTNVPFVDVSQEVYDEIYFQTTGHQSPKSVQPVGTNQVKIEDDSLSVEKLEIKCHQSEKDHGTGEEEPSSIPANPLSALNTVPPVFLWPVHAPLHQYPIHEPSSNQDNAQASGSPDTKDRKTPPDEADSKLSRISTNSSHESVFAILNHIHTSMSSNQDYNILSGIAGKEFTAGKFYSLYKSLPELSRRDIQDEIDKIFTYSDPQLPELVSDYLKSWHTRIQELHQGLESIFTFFVPIQQAGTVLHKYWGSVVTLIRLLAMMCNPHFLHLKSEAILDISIYGFYVVDLEQTVDQRKESSWFPLPTMSFKSCSQCLDGQRYSIVSEARKHLRLVHFDNLSVTDEFLGLWIVYGDHLWDYQVFSDAHTLLFMLSDHIHACLKLANEIKTGVGGTDGFDRDVYRVPVSLVQAFQSLLMFIAYIGRLCTMIQEKRQGQVPYRPLTLIDHAQTQNIQNLGFRTEGLFGDGKNDLMLMSHAAEYSRAISYESVGPEYIIGLLIESLAARTDRPDALNLNSLYREFASHLGYKASRRPRRRLLSKMVRTLEEVEYVRDVIEEQGNLMNLYKDLLNPQTFRIVGKSREAVYDLETALLSHSASKRNDEAESYEDLITDIEEMIAGTKALVEIEQDDHGKAILVFTTVTIIFLPLSFVTSYLGMNTQDIRDQKNSQSIFWAAALPLTLVVVLVSMSIGYRSDDLRDSWEKLFTQKLRHKALEPQGVRTHKWRFGDSGNEQHERSRRHDTRSTSADDVESGRL
ncbi:hypothetical protein GJ744_004759 [Endocarpon pusillum]|uniref:Uncharacterized protein n=1 Tax=Endocarpon pusillum TaxID=364733 RepID=A0A8H7A989_9EURO|nr:hypothetical protein GJ744_004759 [Endocarpon pusillum]